jgi:glycosyltransferase involved in cell wall biosynthesis
VVQFAVPRPDDLLADDGVIARHGLPDRYFYLPNQFWQHKNHRLVIDALALARKQAPTMTVVSTGSPIDHRDPGHFDRLKAHVADLGLQDAFRFAGLVPSADVPQLALHSVAVVNPSHFEGWSTTVEESKSLGVPLVLSSIAVHREQAGDRALYFDPRSPDSCAAALLSAWRNEQEPAAERLKASAESAQQRALEFARKLYEALYRAAMLETRS